MKIRKLFTLLSLSSSLSLGLFMPTNAYAFDFFQFFSDIFKSAPIAGSRAAKDPKKEAKKKLDPNSPEGKLAQEEEDNSSIPNSGAVVVADLSIDRSLKRQGNCAQNYPWCPPAYRDKSKDAEIIFLCKAAFAVGYSTEYRAPIWVAEVVDRYNLADKKTSRTDNFMPDPQIPKKLQASNDTYLRSGFDRGHLAAAENVRYSEQGMNESFYFTNIVPQVGANMNRGIWAELENWTRAQANLRGSLYVVSGAIYIGDKYPVLPGGVGVPTHLYKVIIDPKINEAISFIIPNIQIISETSREISPGSAQYPQTLAKNVYRCSDRGKTNCNIFDFSAQMSEVERLTGLKFISSMSDQDVMRFKVSDDFIQTRRY